MTSKYVMTHPCADTIAVLAQCRELLIQLDLNADHSTRDRMINLTDAPAAELYAAVLTLHYQAQRVSDLLQSL